MALKFSKMPNNAIKALERGLKILPEKKHARLLQLKKSDIHQNTPHKMYTLELEDILSGEGLSRAKHVSWRYITEDSIVEVQRGENEGEFEFTEINQGMHVKDILEKLKIMEKHSKIKKGDYEVSMIMVPALYVMALWLQDKEKKDDIIIPVGLVHPHLAKHPHTLFTPDEFIKTLKKAAEKRAAFDDSPVEESDCK